MQLTADKGKCRVLTSSGTLWNNVLPNLLPQEQVDLIALSKHYAEYALAGGYFFAGEGSSQILVAQKKTELGQTELKIVDNQLSVLEKRGKSSGQSMWHGTQINELCIF